MGKNRRHRRLAKLVNRLRWPFITGGLVVVVVAALATVTFLINQDEAGEQKAEPLPKEKRAELEERLQNAEHDRAIYDRALEVAKSGDVNEIDDLYKEAIGTESDSSRKVKLYIDQSEILYNSGKVKEAIEIAKKAETISDDKFLIADWLSVIYEDQKDYRSAEKYYLLAAEWAESETNRARLTEKHYKDAAVRVARLAKE